MIFLCDDYEQLYKLWGLYLFLFSYVQYVHVNKANLVHNLFLVYLRINCAQSWLYLQEYTGMHSQQYDCTVKDPESVNISHCVLPSACESTLVPSLQET